MTQPFHVDITDGIATVTLDRPKANAIDAATSCALGEAFASFETNPDVRVVIYTAAGERFFSAGWDLGAAADGEAFDSDYGVGGFGGFCELPHRTKPVIAAVNGPALGAGCVLASVCDIRIASEKATFGLPEINVGRCGGGAHMGRLVPPGLLRLMVFTGEPISAWEAHRVGLVEQLVNAKRLRPAAMELAQTIAAKSPIGLRLGKESINKAEFMQVEDGYAMEQTYSTRLLQTEDAREATRADACSDSSRAGDRKLMLAESIRAEKYANSAWNEKR